MLEAPRVPEALPPEVLPIEEEEDVPQEWEEPLEETEVFEGDEETNEDPEISMTEDSPPEEDLFDEEMQEALFTEPEAEPEPEADPESEEEFVEEEEPELEDELAAEDSLLDYDDNASQDVPADPAGPADSLGSELAEEAAHAAELQHTCSEASSSVQQLPAQEEPFNRDSILGLMNYLKGLSGSLPEGKKDSFMKSDARLSLEYMINTLEGKKGLLKEIKTKVPSNEPPAVQSGTAEVPIATDKITGTLSYLGNLSGSIHDKNLFTALRKKVQSITSKINAVTDKKTNKQGEE